MKIAFISDPIESFDVKKDSTFFIIKTYLKKQHNVSFFLSKEIFFNKDNVYGNGNEIFLNNIYKGIRSIKLNKHKKPIKLSSYDIIFIRKDPPINEEYKYLLQLLTFIKIKNNKPLIINNPKSVLLFNEKTLGIKYFNNFCPTSIISNNKKILKKFVFSSNKVILKPINNMGGNSIFYIDNNFSKNTNVIIEVLTKNNNFVIGQHYIQDVEDTGDTRIFLINGDVFHYVITRLQKSKHDFRCNIAKQSVYFVRKISKYELHISKKISNFLKNLGILFAGLDMIGSYVTEINITNTTLLQEIYLKTKINIADIILEKILK